MALAPNKPAISASRTNPVTLDIKVNKETVDAALRRFIRRSVSTGSAACFQAIIDSAY
jgi:hypothetical protein